jgi:hypothetical protein
MLDTAGNITLDRADTFNLAFDDEEGTVMDPKFLTFYVSKDDIETPSVLFTIEPTVDAANPSILHFKFTPEHARQLGKKDWAWLILDTTSGSPETLAKGAIRAVGFAV